MQRRSSQRTPRKKYTTDAFASIPELRDASASPNSRKGTEDDATDDLFDGDAEPKESSDDASEGEVSNEDDEADQVDETIEVDAEDANDETVTPKAKSTRRRKPAVHPDEELHTRGIPEGQRFHIQASRSAKKHMYWGSAREDLAIVQKAVDKWNHLPVLPSQEAGFHPPFLRDKPTYERSIDQDWTWCESTAINKIPDKQIVTAISLEEVKQLLPRMDRVFLMGAFSQPEQFMLPAGACMSIQSAFKRSRSGCVLNLGAKILCLDWLPHQPGHYQYLALTTAVERPDITHCEAPEAPAFTATSPYQTILQVWRFNLKDSSSTPRLKALLSTKFGAYKKFQFCHFPARISGQTPRLMGGLWSDGGVRVILLPKISDEDELEVHHISQTVMESKAVDTMYTCFAWMSPQRIAAGCANGCLAVFDLKDAMKPDCHNLKPWKYAAISPTYIVGIASCSPSCPNLVFTSSMDGFIRLTDTAQTHMSSPSATVHGARARTILGHCVWHDYVRAAILTEDTFGIRLHLVRRIFNLFTIGRTRSTPTSIAVSACHPFLLVGTAAGDVQSLNPMVKLTDSKAPLWQQTWFAHEWRRGKGEEAVDAESRHIAKYGLSRFTEGYKPEKMALTRVAGGAEGGPAGFATNTVYEKPTAVTALAWNPNPHVGGWAAAGMGDGLLRVEDIALPA